jgi:hypothetical protein
MYKYHGMGRRDCGIFQGVYLEGRHLHRIKGTASKLSRSYQEWTEYPHPPLIEWNERSRLLRLVASYVFTRRQCAQMSPFTERRFTPISDLSLHLNLVQIPSSPNFELLTLILATPILSEGILSAPQVSSSLPRPTHHHVSPS